MHAVKAECYCVNGYGTVVSVQQRPGAPLIAHMPEC